MTRQKVLPNNNFGTRHLAKFSFQILILKSKPHYSTFTFNDLGNNFENVVNFYLIGSTIIQVFLISFLEKYY